MNPIFHHRYKTSTAGCNIKTTIIQIAYMHNIVLFILQPKGVLQVHAWVEVFPQANLQHEIQRIIMTVMKTAT